MRGARRRKKNLPKTGTQATWNPPVGIILQAGEVPDAQAVPLDPEAELPLISATRQQFADIFHTGDADSDQIMAARGFWMLIDKGVITEIFEPYEE